MQPTLSLIRQAPRSVYFLFLTCFTIYFLYIKVKFAPGFVHDFKPANFAWIHRYFSWIPRSPLTVLLFPSIGSFPAGRSKDFLSCLFPPPVLQSNSVNGMQREGERPGAAVKFNHLMTKTRLRGSPCSGLRGSQKGSTAPCRG